MPTKDAEILPMPAPARSDWRSWLEAQFQRCAALVRAVVWQRLGRPRDRHCIDELAAETWVRAVRGAQQGTFDPERDFAAWVCGIAGHVCHEHLRRRRRTEAELPAAAELPDPLDHERARELLDLHRALADCIAQLEDTDHRLYQLRYEQGLSGRAAAATLGVPEASLREKLQPKLLRKLAHCLARKGYSEALPGAAGLRETSTMIPTDQIHNLLLEHAAARRCGLLHDGPTSTEQRRLASILGGRRGQRARCLLAVAAALLLSAGSWLGLGWLDAHAVVAAREATILHGRGRVVTVGADTRYTITDAAQGRIRLEQGELYVELPAAAGLHAEVETPAGTAVARGTRFYAHHSTLGSPATLLLAVVVLGGSVEVSNPHGRALGGPGDVLMAEAGAAPEQHSTALRSPHPPLGCPFTSALGLIYRPEIQAELRVSAAQQARLQRPDRDERREICQFFRSLQTLPRRDWSKLTADFCASQQRHLAQVLSAAQQQRLREIGLQSEGPFALARPEIADQLRLTPAQREQVVTRLKEYSDAYRALAAGGKTTARAIALQQQTGTRLLALLTEAQQVEWRKLCGVAFTPQRP